MEMLRALELIGDFTADQWGMITSRQATGLGLDRPTLHRLTNAGHLDHVRHGVYASTAAGITAAREQQAAWLALNPAVASWERPLPDPDGGVLSHQSAINIHGLGELVNDRITFTTPRRRTSRDPDVWFKIAELAEDDIVLVDSLPVTTVLRTICDLLDQHIDGSHIATIIREGVIANMVGLDELAEHIGPFALRYGVRRPGDGLALLDHLLAQIGTSTVDMVNRPAPEQAREIAAAATLLPNDVARVLRGTGDVSAVLRAVAEAGMRSQRHQFAGALQTALAAADLSAGYTPALRAIVDAIGPQTAFNNTLRAALASAYPPEVYSPALQAIVKATADAGKLSALHQVSEAIRATSAQALGSAFSSDTAAEPVALPAGASATDTTDHRDETTSDHDDHDRTEASNITEGLPQLGAGPGQERGEANGDVLR